MRHHNRKPTIRQGAFSVFAKEGYHGLSMRQLATALGVTTGTLYHHYKSKDELFLDLVRHQAVADIEAASRIVHGRVEFSERFEALSDFVAERSEYFTQLILIILDLMRSTGSGNDDESFAEMKEAIIAAVAQYRKAIAVVLDLDDEKSARAVFSYIIGSLLQSLVGAPTHCVTDLATVLQTLNLKERPHV